MILWASPSKHCREYFQAQFFKRWLSGANITNLIHGYLHIFNWLVTTYYHTKTTELYTYICQKMTVNSLSLYINLIILTPKVKIVNNACFNFRKYHFESSFYDWEIILQWWNQSLTSLVFEFSLSFIKVSCYKGIAAKR